MLPLHYEATRQDAASTLKTSGIRDASFEPSGSRLRRLRRALDQHRPVIAPNQQEESKDDEEDDR